MTKLKDCPFCKGKALVINGVSKAMVDKIRCVCNECWAGTNWYKAEEEAIAAWNRRVPLECEAIDSFAGYEWLVLTTDDDGNQLIVSKYVLDRMNFESAKRYLVDFYEGLSAHEKAQVQPVYLPEENSYQQVRLSKVDTDKSKQAFLLSFGEVVSYFDNWDEREAIDIEGANRVWWLRSPGTAAPSPVAVVGSGGVVNGTAAANASFGVRPALWISPQSENHSICPTCGCGNYRSDTSG